MRHRLLDAVLAAPANMAGRYVARGHSYALIPLLGSKPLWDFGRVRGKIAEQIARANARLRHGLRFGVFSFHV